jgi:hypothetical protein
MKESTTDTEICKLKNCSSLSSPVLCDQQTQESLSYSATLPQICSVLCKIGFSVPAAKQHLL